MCMNNMREFENKKATRVRYSILLLICIMTAVNYMGRTNIAVAAPYIEKELGLAPAQMGIVFSSFAWTYVLGQIPSGWILDRFGSRVVYGISMLLWSVIICMIGWATSLTALILCRLGLGICGAPTFPANSRIVAAWFPSHERGLAAGGYIGAQFVGLAFLTPLLTWIIVSAGWPSIFFITGVFGVIFALIWCFIYREPAQHHKVNAQELSYIRDGGGLCHVKTKEKQMGWDDYRQLLGHRQLCGMCIGHFSMASTTYFFITWFPSYLVNAKGLSLLEAGVYASAPFLAALVGVTAGGRWSDWMLTRGYSFGASRKTPIMTGLLFTCCIAAANYTEHIGLIIGIMSFAFFGLNMASTCGWALLSDVAPRQMIGVTGGLYNLSSNLGGVVTPMLVGFIVEATASYDLALVFVTSIAFVGLVAYALIVGSPYRIEIDENSM